MTPNKKLIEGQVKRGGLHNPPSSPKPHIKPVAQNPSPPSQAPKQDTGKK